MKTIKLCLIGLAVLALGFSAGCGETVDEGPDTGGDGDSDSDADADGGTPGEPDLSDCDSTKTCAGLATPSDCIADFGYVNEKGVTTNQAGYKDDYNLGYVGFYGYNDVTEGATQLPVPNYFSSEPAEEIKSCDANNDYALHFYVEGFDGWGAGVGMDWGGDENADCEVDGALDCLQLRIDNDHTALSTAEGAAACQNDDGSVNEAKINCFKYGKYLNAPKNLSDYKALGFWTLTTDSNENDTLKVTFPIPASMRFYGEYYNDTFNYDGKACSEDDEPSTNDCYNDYYATVSLPTSGEDDINKWVYHEISFNDLKLNSFGLQLADETVFGPSYTHFQPTQSMGLKFQVDTWQAPIATADFYLDDVTLIPK